MDKNYDVRLDGIGKINGGIYKNIRINGVGTILGEIEADDINIDGSIKAKGNIKCNNISVDGTFKCNGNIEATKKISINGCPKVEGDIQAKEVSIDGKINIDGLISADRVDISLSGKNYVKEIGGEEINVIACGYVFWSKPMLTIDSIEGDNIILENTICNIVRGHDVTINGGCNIKRLEYTGKLTVNDNSKVNDVVKL